MGFRSQLKERAMGISQKALERLFADESRAAKIAEAVGAVQRGKETLDKTHSAVMHQFNFATRGDFKELGKKISALKRRLRSVGEKIDAL